MPGNDDEVGVRLVVDGQEVWSSKFTKATESVKRFGDEARKQQAQVKAIGSELDRSAARAQNLGKEFESAFGSGRSAVSSFVSPLNTALSTSYNLASRLAWPIAGITAGLTAAAGAATYFGLKTYSSLEQANVAFTQFLGSAQAGTDFVNQLKQFAATTPFNFVNLVPDTQKLLNTGDNTNQALKDLTAIGDAAAGTASGQEGIDRITLAISQIKASPSVHAQDLNQLVQAGINPYAIMAQAKGVSEGQLRNDVMGGKIPGAAAVDVLLSGFEKKYGGLMAKENKTLQGQLSNLHDTITFELADASKPLADLLERDMPTITNELQKLAHLYGVTLSHVISDAQTLGAAFQRGGMSGLLDKLGEMTGTGSSLDTIWQHISKDSQEIADIWQNSLAPAIGDVEQMLGPFAGITLHTLEDILKWMDDHPEAARKIFDEMFIAFTAYKLTALVLGLGMAFGRLVLALDAASAGYGRLAGSAELATGAMAESDVAALGGTGAGALGALGTAGKYAGIAGLTGIGGYEAYQGIANGSGGGGFLQSAGGGAGLGAGIGLFFGPEGALIGGGVGGALGAGAYGLKKLVGGQASGGRTIGSGWSVTGEKGPELQWMPDGAQVVPLEDTGGSKYPLGSIVFEKGAIVVEAADYLQGDAVGKAVIEHIQDALARK